MAPNGGLQPAPLPCNKRKVDELNEEDVDELPIFNNRVAQLAIKSVSDRLEPLIVDADTK
jgi:hypothetical protein